MSYIQTNEVITLPYANSVINPADSGKIILTPQTAVNTGVVYTLPTVTAKAGLHYRFINSAPAALSGSVQFNAPLNSLYGGVIAGPDGAATYVAALIAGPAAASQVRFATGQSVRGDYIDLYYDGTVWYLSGVTGALAGITYG